MLKALTTYILQALAAAGSAAPRSTRGQCLSWGAAGCSKQLVCTGTPLCKRGDPKLWPGKLLHFTQVHPSHDFAPPKEQPSLQSRGQEKDVPFPVFWTCCEVGENNLIIPGGLRAQTSLLSLGHGRAQRFHGTVTNGGKEGLSSAGGTSPPCPNPKDTGAPLEQQAARC